MREFMCDVKIKIQINAGDNFIEGLEVVSENIEDVPHDYLEKYKGEYPALSECFDYTMEILGRVKTNG